MSSRTQEIKDNYDSQYIAAWIGLLTASGDSVARGFGRLSMSSAQHLFTSRQLAEIHAWKQALPSQYELQQQAIARLKIRHNIKDKI